MINKKNFFVLWHVRVHSIGKLPLLLIVTTFITCHSGEFISSKDTFNAEARISLHRASETRTRVPSIRFPFPGWSGRPMASDEPAGLMYLTCVPSGSVLGTAREHHRVSYVPFLRPPPHSTPLFPFCLPTRTPLALAIDDVFDSKRFVIQCSTVESCSKVSRHRETKQRLCYAYNKYNR